MSLGLKRGTVAIEPHNVEWEISAQKKLQQNLQKAYQAYLLLEGKVDDEDAEETMEQCDNVFYENEGEINQLLTEYATKIVV